MAGSWWESEREVIMASFLTGITGPGPGHPGAVGAGRKPRGLSFCDSVDVMAAGTTFSEEV